MSWQLSSSQHRESSKLKIYVRVRRLLDAIVDSHFIKIYRDKIILSFAIFQHTGVKFTVAYGEWKVGTRKDW